MCGRYASPRSGGDLLETFTIEAALADEEKPPDYNVAPTKTDGQGTGTAGEPLRESGQLRVVRAVRGGDGLDSRLQAARGESR